MPKKMSARDPLSTLRRIGRLTYPPLRPNTLHRFSYYYFLVQVVPRGFYPACQNNFIIIIFIIKKIILLIERIEDTMSKKQNFFHLKKYII